MKTILVVLLLAAAPLLLPYFEVDYNAPVNLATRTYFWVQNVSRLPQIADQHRGRRPAARRTSCGRS